MKVKNTKIIQFNLAENCATIQLTENKKITIDNNTIIAHRYTTGYRGYWIVIKNTFGEYRWMRPSVKVAKVICKYIEPTTRDFDYDHYRIPFEKLTT